MIVGENLNVANSQEEDVIWLQPANPNNTLGDRVEVSRCLSTCIILTNLNREDIIPNTRLIYHNDKVLKNLFSMVNGVRHDLHRVIMEHIRQLIAYAYNTSKNTARFNRTLLDDYKHTLVELLKEVSLAAHTPTKSYTHVSNAIGILLVVDGLTAAGFECKIFNVTNLDYIVPHLAAIIDGLGIWQVCIRHKNELNSKAKKEK